MKQIGIKRTIKDFFQTTTLHGFKYLTSGYYVDRVIWLVWCCASACCAGVLCAVLWVRFLQVPALLTLQDLRVESSVKIMPQLAICAPAERVSSLFVNNLTVLSVWKSPKRLASILARVLRRKSVPKGDLLLLQQLFLLNNVTINDLYYNMPPCSDIVKKCRWMDQDTQCEELFMLEYTQNGMCCVMRPTRLKSTLLDQLEQTKVLDIVMRCFNERELYDCEFFTKYNSEEWIQPVPLTPGNNYNAKLSFTLVQDGDTEKLFGSTCVSSDSYSRSDCLSQCQERLCGCTDPLRDLDTSRASVPNTQKCSISNIDCLRTYDLDFLLLTEESKCTCLPPCKKITTILSLEMSRFNELEFTYDPIYTGLNETSDLVLRFDIRKGSSKVFTRQSTETWLTLLSSLGGVFNMFLGVGLFSALEFLFLIFVKFPIAIRRSPEMETAHITVYERP